MKGLVFISFLEFLELRLGIPALEDLLAQAPLATGGAFTAVGSYPDEEFGVLLGAGCAALGTEAPETLEEFGIYLFRRLAWEHEDLVGGYCGVLELLRRLDEHIHASVKAIHPDAEVPEFEVLREEGASIVLEYRSPRALEPLARGLLRGCFEHFNEPHTVCSEPHPSDPHRFTFFIDPVNAAADGSASA